MDLVLDRPEGIGAAGDGLARALFLLEQSGGFLEAGGIDEVERSHRSTSATDEHAGVGGAGTLYTPWAKAARIFSGFMGISSTRTPMAL